MKALKTLLKDCFVIDSVVFNDKRGYFFESFHQLKFEQLTGQSIHFVQDNESFSTRGTLRGLHFQKGKHAQAKLVRAVSGEILDVAVDLRENSSTYGLYDCVILSGENKQQLFIPRGFAHGFVVLSNEAIVAYKCDNHYDKASESGIAYNDPFLHIDWRLSPDELLISPKDLALPFIKNMRPLRST